MYGAELMEALRRHFSIQPDCGATGGRPVEQGPRLKAAGEGARATPTLEFFGVGGEKMRVAGCELIVDAKDLSVVGITEILGHLPKIWRLFHRLIAEAARRRPDFAVVIDSPAFNWRVAREIKKRGVPVVYYVCPQFWAWRQGRVRYLRKYVDKALVIFPFEEKFYRERGVDAEFVGHPLAELPRPAVSREEYAVANGLDPNKTWITLMPGSRRKEVRMNLPEMLNTVSLFSHEYEFLLPLAPTLDRNFVAEILASHASKIAKAGAPSAMVGEQSKLRVHLATDALPALAHSRAAIIASGTATVEAAMMETPFVMVYRVTSLTYLLGRWTVRVPYFAMVNLIAGEKVVPELVQRDFMAENVFNEMTKIIPDGGPRRKMLVGLQRVKRLLRGQSAKGQAAEEPAADRAAKVIAATLGVCVPAPAKIS
jgi:lipid-A-disaccharide synthase